LERVQEEAGRGESRASSAVAGREDAADMDSCDNSDADNEEGVGGDDNMRALERCVLEFFIALLDYNVGDNKSQNTLYSALAVLGICEGHS
jgi:hypothetical protein